jgi:hypothetical protein
MLPLRRETKEDPGAGRRVGIIFLELGFFGPASLLDKPQALDVAEVGMKALVAHFRELIGDSLQIEAPSLLYCAGVMGLPFLMASPASQAAASSAMARWRAPL